MNQNDSIQQLEQEYQEAVNKYNVWYCRCRQSIEFFNQNKFKKDAQVKCIEPIVNFLNGKTKVQIFIHGPISSGNCILPSKNIETTQTIVQIQPDQEFPEGKFKINDEEIYDVKEMYFRINQINQQNQKQKQNSENIRRDELTNKFQCLIEFKENPLIKNKQLQIIDKPGSDSQEEGKDVKVFESLNQQYQGNSPFINIYMTTPNNYNKQSTIDILEKFRIYQYKKIQEQIAEQQQFTQQIQKLITDLDEQLYRDETDIEKIFQQSFCLLVNQKDTLSFGGEKELKEKCKNYLFEPFFISSLQELQWNVLQFSPNPHNLRILLQDENFRKKCLSLYDDSNFNRLSDIDPMQWLDQDLQLIIEKRQQIIKENFRKVDTGSKKFVLQMMTKITQQSAYFLENIWKKYDLISKTYEYISDLEIIKFIEKNNQDDFIKDKLQFQQDYALMKENFTQELNVTMRIFQPEFKRLTEYLLNNTLQNIHNISQAYMIQSVNKDFFDPLDQQLNIILEFNQKRIKFQLDLIVMQLKKFFPEQMNEERIKIIIQSLQLCQQNIEQENKLQFDDFKNQIQAYVVILIGIILGLSRIAAGIWAAEYASFLAFTGVGAVIGGVGLLASGAYIYNKQQDQEIKKDQIRNKINVMYEKFGEEQRKRIHQYDQAIKVIFWKLETGFQISQQQ